jgi:Tetratricopeptide repeat/Bacterial SH3 domain
MIKPIKSDNRRMARTQAHTRTALWVIFTLSIGICAVPADTISLKSGETLKGQITSESDLSVTISTDTSTGKTDKTIAKSEIVGMTLSSPAGKKPEAVAAETPSGHNESEEKSSSKSGQKPDVTPDAEGFYGVPDAVIDDPDGYVNVRKEKTADSAIVAKVKKNEPFEFQCGQNATWCKVKLASGVTGWMDYSRIKRYYTERDLPKGPEDSGEEIDEQTREQGVNYYEVTLAAARGNKKALKTFFSVGLDGAALETHITSIVEVVIHLVGDDKFAQFLREQSPIFRENISRDWDSGTFAPFNPKEYFQRHFPKSAGLVFPDYHQLIRDYTDAVKRNPKDSELYRRRGNAEYKHEDWDRAIADFTRAIEVDPNSGVAYWNRGWAHAEKKEYDAAIKDMQKASQLQPNEPGYQRDMEEIKALQTKKPK